MKEIVAVISTGLMTAKTARARLRVVKSPSFVPATGRVPSFRESLRPLVKEGIYVRQMPVRQIRGLP